MRNLFQCVNECMFNKSGLNKEGKLVREDVTKLFISKAKNESDWSQLITKAIDACFLESKFISTNLTKKFF